jgi:hypothetical protein
VAVSAAIQCALFLASSLAAACSDPPQTVHAAFMSLKPMFFYGEGQCGESHGEEKVEEELKVEVKRASL